jgi:hypothetical protein
MSTVSRRRFALSVRLVVMLAIALLAVPAVALAATIHGTVTDATGPLENVRVLVIKVGPWTSSQQVTGADGTFSITGLATGTYLVRFDDNYDQHAAMYWPNASYVQSYDPQPPTIELTAADSDEDASVEMQRGIAGIHVDVVRADGTTPVSNIIVTPYRKATPPYATDMPFEDALTDSAGECTFYNLPAGEWYVWASDPDSGTPQRLYLNARAPSSGESSMGPTWSWTATLTMKRLPFIAPTTSRGAWGELGWWKSGTDGIPITITRSAGDFDLSASRGFYTFGEGISYQWTDESLVTTFTGEGRHTLVALARLIPPITGAPFPGSEPTVSLTIGIDNSAPVTTSNAGSLVSQPALVLSAFDAYSGSGGTYYQIDGVVGDIWTMPAYSGPVALSPGAHTVYYWSEDNAGNLESLQTGTIISGPQPGVSRPSGSSSVRKNRSATYRGTLTKRVKNHSHLQLQASRWDGAQWVLTRTKTVDVHTPRRGKPTYGGSIKFTSKGRWRVVAYYRGDGIWQQAWSASKYVTVR